MRKILPPGLGRDLTYDMRTDDEKWKPQAHPSTRC